MPALVVSFPEQLDTRLKAALKAGKRDSLGQALDWWHVRALPGHFTEAGARKYGYVPRGQRYQKRKQRKKKTGDPLVFTGTLRTAMLLLKPMPTYSGDVATARYRGLPWYTAVRQKVSLEQIGEALEQYDGDLKAAAVSLGVSLRTITRRLGNQADVHEGVRLKKWRELQEEMGRFVNRWKTVDVLSEWRIKHAAAVAIFAQFGNDITKSAEAMGVSKSKFAQYLRNAEYKGRTPGQTVDKVQELTTITPEEAAMMARQAERIYQERLNAAQRAAR